MKTTKGAFGGSTGKRTWTKRKYNPTTKKWVRKLFSIDASVGKGAVGHKLARRLGN
ncbi:MAG: hypothetical protein PF569_02305 [Candidatus Woesearchaeota archaeon]|jgi:heme oxygenase|nr:hypothetical protein [Candidatus Woesearchaeota archaeon]